MNATEDLAISEFLVEMIYMIKSILDKKNMFENEVDNCCFS